MASWYANDLYNRYYPVVDMKMMGVTSGIIFTIAVAIISYYGLRAARVNPANSLRFE